MSFGQAAVTFCLPGATSCSSYKLLISFFKLRLPSKKIYLFLTIGRTFFLVLFTVQFFRALAELGWGQSPEGRPVGHSIELISYKIKTTASQTRWSTSKATRKIGDCVFSLARKLKWLLHPYRVRTVNFDRFPLVAFFMSSATVHMVGKALLVFICPRFSRAFSTSSWLAEKYMTSFSSGSPWNLAEISSFSRSHSCFFMTRISTEFPCLNTSSENKIEKKTS